MFIWIAAAFAAFFVKGLCGFANTLVFNTLLSFSGNKINNTPVELVLGYPSNFIIAWHERKNIKPAVVIPIAAMVMAGSLLGVFLLKNTDVRLVKILFGAVVVLVGAEMLLRKPAKEAKPDKSRSEKVLTPGLLLIGILSGILCGLYGVGALLGAYISRVTRGSGEFKGNICTVFVIENTFRVILYAATGILTAGTLRMALKLAPVMLLGLFAGIKAASFLDERVVRKLIIVMLVVSGAALIVTNI